MSGWRSSIATMTLRRRIPSAAMISGLSSLVLRGSGVTLLSLLDVLDEVQRGQLAFIPLRSTLLRPLTPALCTAPSRQLSRPAQMAIQTLSAVIESMATVSPAAR